MCFNYMLPRLRTNVRALRDTVDIPAFTVDTVMHRCCKHRARLAVACVHRTVTVVRELLQLLAELFQLIRGQGRYTCFSNIFAHGPRKRTHDHSSEHVSGSAPRSVPTNRFLVLYWVS